MHNSIKSRHGYMDSIRFACVYDVVYRRTYIRPRCNPRAHARKHLQFRFVSKVLIVMANEFRVDFFLLLFAVCSQRLCGLSNCHDAHRTSTSVTINRGCALQNAWLASHTHTHTTAAEKFYRCHWQWIAIEWPISENFDFSSSRYSNGNWFSVSVWCWWDAVKDLSTLGISSEMGEKVGQSNAFPIEFGRRKMGKLYHAIRETSFFRH